LQRQRNVLRLKKNCGRSRERTCGTGGAMEKLTAGKILGHSVLLKKIEAESQRKSLRPKGLSYNNE